MTIEEIEIVVTAKVEEALQKIKEITPTIQKSAKQAQEAFSKVDTKVMTNKLHQAVNFMKKKMQDLKKSSKNNELSIKVNNQDAKRQITQIEKEIDSLQKKITGRQLKLDITNTALDKIRNDTNQSVIKEIPNAGNKQIKTETYKRLDNNTNYNLLVSQSDKLNREIERYNELLNVAKSKMSQLGQQTTQTATTQSKLSSYFNVFKNKIEQARTSSKGLKSTLNQMPKITQNITNNIKGIGRSLKDGIGRVLRYAAALIGLRSIYQTLKNCATSWLSSQNIQAQQLSANIEYMKYAMGSVFAPVIQFVTNLVYNLMKAVQSLVYAFSGVNIFAKATANSMKSASGSAKQASKSLSSIHSEINNVSDNNSAGSGETTPSIDLSQVDNSMLVWANKWKEKLINFFKPFIKAWGKYGQPTIEKTKNAINKIKEVIDVIKESWEKVWNNGTIQYMVELILLIIQNICDIIANIAEAWKKAWSTDNRGTELIQAMCDTLNKLLTLIEILTNKIKEFTSNPIVQEYFQNAIEMVTNFWNALGGLIEFLTGVFTGDWEKAWSGLKDFVSGIFGMIWNAINSKILMIKGIISNVLEGIKNIWRNIWNGIKDFASNVWENLLNKIDSIFPGMRNIIETNITNVKNKINEILNNIKSTWNNIWNGIKDKTSEIWNNIWSAVKNPINWILGGVEKMANGVVTGVNKVIRSLNNMHFKMPDWLGGGSFDINIPTMSGVSLPRLATGNVAYDETLAVFGEYSGARSNPEITAPQSIIRETFEDVLSNYEGSKSNNSGELKTLVIQFGSTKVALEMERLLQQARRQNGTAYAGI